MKNQRMLAMSAAAAALATPLATWATPVVSPKLGDVFYIEMENHNSVQPNTVAGINQLYGNSAAPYLNSLITPNNANSIQSSWASNYTSVGSSVHPSLPNYLWQEAGTNNGVQNDNQPFIGGNGTPPANQGNTPSLSALLQANGISWKSYQEDTQLAVSNSLVTSTVKPQSQWTVPLTNLAGTSASYTNAYNGSHQYDFATKHDGQLYFNATNGGNDSSTSNPEIPHYAPLQQLTSDLNANSVARYNLITPDQFNDAHTALATGFTYNGVLYPNVGRGSVANAQITDQANIAQGDNFLSQIVPQIEASQAYKNNGAIVIWWDETELGDTSGFKLSEIVLSPLAKGNAYNSTLSYTHSSDLKSLQELYGVYSNGQTGQFLGAANSPATTDLSDLFKPNAIPEPGTLSVLGIGAIGLLARRRRNA